MQTCIISYADWRGVSAIPSCRGGLKAQLMLMGREITPSTLVVLERKETANGKNDTKQAFCDSARAQEAVEQCWKAAEIQLCCTFSLHERT